MCIHAGVCKVHVLVQVQIVVEKVGGHQLESDELIETVSSSEKVFHKTCK